MEFNQGPMQPPVAGPEAQTPEGMPMGMPGGMPESMPEEMPVEEEMPMEEAPMEEEPVAAPGDEKTNELKRQLLQKLMSNLLGKPGRSVNELVNGVKDVMGAYKSYAKEIDALSGVTESPVDPGASQGSPAGAGQEQSGDVQSILEKIQANKASGQGGPGVGNRPAPVSRLGIWGY